MIETNINKQKIMVQNFIKLNSLNENKFEVITTTGTLVGKVANRVDLELIETYLKNDKCKLSVYMPFNEQLKSYGFFKIKQEGFMTTLIPFNIINSSTKELNKEFEEDKELVKYSNKFHLLSSGL